MVTVRPPMPYFGGKMQLASSIAALLPGHQHYVEPFCGSLAVLLAKRPSAMETVNDIDGDLMLFWRVLRDHPNSLERVCALTPHSRAEHDASYDLDACPTELERARRVWVQLTQGRAGVRSRTGWRHYIDPAGSSSSMPRYLRGYVQRIGPAVERLAGVSLECLPALDIIAKYGQQPNVLLYVDPPYLGETRQSGGYVHEMRGEDEHLDLLAALLNARSAVVLSGYASPLYDEMLSHWDRHTLVASTGQGGMWGNRTEVLWSNRPLGEQPTLDGLETEVDWC